jgi:hypothetical protein
MDQKSIAPRSTKTVPMKVPNREEIKNKKASMQKHLLRSDLSYFRGNYKFEF